MTNFTLAQAIGSDLITEVRRLNTLLGERDKALKETNTKLSELEKAHETMKTQVRSDQMEKGKCCLLPQYPSAPSLTCLQQ